MIKLRSDLLVSWVRIRKKNFSRRFWLYKCLDHQKSGILSLASQSLFVVDILTDVERR